jgi:hypothetical protein
MAELRGMRQAQQVAHDTGLIGVDGSKLMRPNGSIVERRRRAEEDLVDHYRAVAE